VNRILLHLQVDPKLPDPAWPWFAAFKWPFEWSSNTSCPDGSFGQTVRTTDVHWA